MPGKGAPPTRAASLPRLVFAWSQFGPYHMDRCEALARALAGRREVIGLELVSNGEIYQWPPSGAGRGFCKRTLFPGKRHSEVGGWRHLAALLGACLASQARHVFLCDFQLPPVFVAALLLRLAGRCVVIMQDSKFDDKPRQFWREVGKALLYLPYHAAFVGGHRSRNYLEFLGLPRGRIVLGYDTVSLDRLCRLAGTEPAPGGAPHGERHFTVIARFVPQKNLELALEAYAAYCRACVGEPRELRLCGAGPLDAALRGEVARRGLSGVRFCGWLDEAGVARVLATSLALILPSREEPFGLVINEAIALGVPVLASESCGACDLLVRCAVNGYVVEPDNAEGLARFMACLAGDEAEWRRLCVNSRRFRPAADTAAFVAGVEALLHLDERGKR
jgi:glycosyltransferase involved in cell wall biosynthesis